MKDSTITFRRFAILTICAVYLLIAVGSIVRVTGAGMGCPDWPTCFGRLVPPTDVSQLPADYKTRYAIHGREIAEFNVVHTWTEYTNRLIGVMIGLLIFGTFVLSLKQWRNDKFISLNALAAFLLVMFEGWLGAKVVEHNLKPLTVTLHFVLSLVIVIVLTNSIVRSHLSLWRDEIVESKSRVRMWILVAMTILLVQIILGTQVRQQVDEVSKAMNFLNRDSWLTSIGTLFYVHRSFSILVVLIHAYMLRVLFYSGRFNARIITWILVIISLIALLVLSGIIMSYFQIPAYIQPTHILLSALIIGIEYMMYLRIGVARESSQSAHVV